MFSSTSGTFLQRDPLGYSDEGVLENSHGSVTQTMNAKKRRQKAGFVGMNLYEYCKSSPLQYVDPYGLRHIKLTIEYHFDDEDIIGPDGKLLKSIRDEVRRIFNDCFKTCCPKDAAGNLTHTLDISFHQVPNKADFFSDRDKRNFFGIGSGIDGSINAVYGIYDNPNFPTFGYCGGLTCGQINPNRIQTVAEASSVDYQKAIAMAIAHELGHHGIANQGGHTHLTGFVDAEQGKTSGDFSKEICKLICRKLKAT